MLSDDVIVIRNLHDRENQPVAFNLKDVRQSVRDRDMRDRGHSKWYTPQLLQFSNGILSIAMDSEEDDDDDGEEEREEDGRQEEQDDHFLVALDFSDRAAKLGDILWLQRLETRDKLFVRNDSNYLFYGTHSRLGARGHHEWVIRGIGLRERHRLPEENYVQLEDFVGSEIGTTVTFQIHDGYFYALSNQTSFTVEEVDWTSLYTVFCFPLNNPSRKTVQMNKKIFRREHKEGPIHDLWTDLSLQLDERTNELMIIESRREWLNGGSTQSRTFYKQHIWFPQKVEEDEGEAAGPSSEVTQYPAGDPFVDVIDSDNNPHWIPTEPRQPYQVHEEYGKPGEVARSFILAKTKYRAYNLSCSTFIDLVEDASCCGSAGLSACLRLRIGSRRDMPWDLSQKKYLEISQNLDASSTRDAARKLYRYSHIWLWPSQANGPEAADKLHKILNPHGDPATSSLSYSPMQISGVSDERSLVYMVKPSGPRCEADQVGTIVLIAFDPFMRVEPHGGDCQNEHLGWRRERSSWHVG